LEQQEAENKVHQLIFHIILKFFCNLYITVQYQFAGSMLPSTQLLPGNFLQASGMATLVMGAGGQPGAGIQMAGHPGAGIQLAGHPGAAGIQFGGVPMQAVLIPGQDGSLQLAYQMAQPMENTQLQYQFISQPVVQETSAATAPALVEAPTITPTVVHVQEPEAVENATNEVNNQHAVYEIEEVEQPLQPQPHHLHPPQLQQQRIKSEELSPPANSSNSTLDDPQRQCIIEFVDAVSPHPEQTQQHIASISYQQQTSPQTRGESCSPTMKLKGNHVCSAVSNTLFPKFRLQFRYMKTLYS